MEKDRQDAVTNKGAKTLERILAADWAGFRPNGRAITRGQALEELKPGELEIRHSELGPLSVRVSGDVGVLSGGHTEKGTYRGKDVSGRYLCAHVFVNRNGRWQVVASQITKVEQ